MSHHTREKCFILIYIAKTSWWISLKRTKFIFKLWRVFHTDVTGMLRDFYKWWRKTVNVFMLDRFMYLSSHLYMYLESFLLFYLFILRGGGWGWLNLLLLEENQGVALICIKICFDITMFMKYCYPKNGLTLRNIAVYLSTSTKYCKKIILMQYNHLFLLFQLFSC